MKKLFGISFLSVVLCLAAPVYAEGDLPAGNKNCTQNCSGLFDGTTPTVSDNENQEDSTILEIYTWINEQISEFIS